MKGLSNLLEKDLRIVEKKKIWFLIPCIIVAIAIICGIVFGVTKGSAFNLGMDFAGGYTAQVKFTALTEKNFDSYTAQIDEIAENLTDANGNIYGLKIDKYRRIGGDGADSAIFIEYKLIRGFTDDEMNEMTNAFLQEIELKIFKLVPEIETIDTNTVAITYSRSMDTHSSSIIAAINNLYPGVQTVWDNPAGSEDAELFRTLKITNASSYTIDKAALASAITIDDSGAGEAKSGDRRGGSVSSDLINYAIAAVVLALVLMLIYIALRFKDFSYGTASIIALIHDAIILFAFMCIFNIEITATFIAALITIMGYSINNTIIIFDKVRENMKSFEPGMTSAYIANKSIKETVMRSIYTTITTFIMIGMIALVCGIAGITDIVIFAAPILVGLIAGTFSSVFIAPSIWAMINKNSLTKQPVKKKPVKQRETV